jgi:hypothetical protein
VRSVTISFCGRAGDARDPSFSVRRGIVGMVKGVYRIGIKIIVETISIGMASSARNMYIPSSACQGSGGIKKPVFCDLPCLKTATHPATGTGRSALHSCSLSSATPASSGTRSQAAASPPFNQLPPAARRSITGTATPASS